MKGRVKVFLLGRGEGGDESSGQLAKLVMLTRQTLSKHKYTDSVTDIVFFIVCKIYFLWFYRNVGF